MGLVNQVVAHDGLMPAARELAQRIIRHSPLAVASIVTAVSRGLNMAIAEGLLVESEQFARMAPTHHLREGIDAWIERRPPILRATDNHGLPTPSAQLDAPLRGGRARRLSFKLAAEDLNLTPSAISHGIQSLEEWLGVELFVRGNRNLTLTGAGATYCRRSAPRSRSSRAQASRCRDGGRPAN